MGRVQYIPVPAYHGQCRPHLRDARSTSDRPVGVWMIVAETATSCRSMDRTRPSRIGDNGAKTENYTLTKVRESVQ